jgi:hypothetical protein
MAVDFIGQGPQDIAVDRLPLNDLSAQETACRLDHRKGLIQLMGDARGHLTENSHFASLDHMLFCDQTHRDVIRDDDEHFVTKVVGGSHMHARVKGSSRLPDLLDTLDVRDGADSG